MNIVAETGKALRNIAFVALLGFVHICSIGLPACGQENTNHIIADTLADFPSQYQTDPQTGKPTGFAIDIMNAVAERTGLTVTYVVFDTWLAVNQALDEGRIDVIPNMGFTQERKAVMHFTVPVEVFNVSLFVRSSTYDIQEVDDLRSRRVPERIT